MKSILFLSITTCALFFAQASHGQIQKGVLTPQNTKPCPDCPAPGSPSTYGNFYANSSDKTGNAIILYEGNSGTQDEVLRHPLESDNKTFHTTYKDIYFGPNNFVIVGAKFLLGEGPNDEARSMGLQGIKAGRMIELYDDPSGLKSDDWVEVLIKQNINSADYYRLDTFEQSYEDAYVKVTCHYHNGLDGKVSYINTYMTN